MKTFGPLVAALVLCLACSSHAQNGKSQTPQKPSPFATIAAESEKAASAPRTLSTALSPEQVKADLDDYAEYVRWQRQFAKQSWDWHLFSTKLLMFVVLGIVGFGLIITYLQFSRDGQQHLRPTKRQRPTSTTDGTPQAEAGEEAQSKLRLTFEGIEITSQVIGLLVLGFSLAFFYLYVKVVYPMQEVELQKNAQSAVERTLEVSEKR
jgi:hypothetical protein